MKRGEIWLVNLDPTLGAEIQKTRPAIIVNDDQMSILPLRIIVPITDWKPRYSTIPWLVEVLPDTNNHLSKPSAADCFQVRSVSGNRFVRKLGECDASTLTLLEQGLAKVLRLLP
jgi:mRNA interferase MazF